MTCSPVHLCHVLLCHICICVHFRRALGPQAKRCFHIVIASGCTDQHTAQSTHTYLAKALMTDLDFMYKRVILKSDQVPSIIALCDAVKNGWHGEIVPEASSTGESQSNVETDSPEPSKTSWSSSLESPEDDPDDEVDSLIWQQRDRYLACVHQTRTDKPVCEEPKTPFPHDECGWDYIDVTSGKLLNNTLVEKARAEDNSVIRERGCGQTS